MANKLAPCPFHVEGFKLPVTFHPKLDELVCVLCGEERPGFIMPCGAGRPVRIAVIAAFRLGGLDAVNDLPGLGTRLLWRLRAWRMGVPSRTVNSTKLLSHMATKHVQL